MSSLCPQETNRTPSAPLTCFQADVDSEIEFRIIRLLQESTMSGCCNFFKDKTIYPTAWDDAIISQTALSFLVFRGGPWGKSLSLRKRSYGGFPHHFFTFVSQFLQVVFSQFYYVNICLPLSFFGAVPSSLYLSPTDLWSCLGADPLASGKVLWKIPPTLLYIWLLVPRPLL